MDWRATLAELGGCVCLDAGSVVRVLFGGMVGLDPGGGRHPRWLERAVDAALGLRGALAEAARELQVPVHARAALVSGRVWIEPGALSDLDAALRGSPVDLATRLARNAPSGEVLVNAGCWRRVANRFAGQACDTIRSRGSRHPELVYRVGQRLARETEAPAEPVEIVALPALAPDADPPPLPAEALAPA